MERRHYPSDLTDVQWQVIEPLLPAPFKVGARRRIDRREAASRARREPSGTRKSNRATKAVQGRGSKSNAVTVPARDCAQRCGARRNRESRLR